MDTEWLRFRQLFHDHKEELRSSNEMFQQKRDPTAPKKLVLSKLVRAFPAIL